MLHQSCSSVSISVANIECGVTRDLPSGCGSQIVVRERAWMLHCEAARCISISGALCATRGCQDLLFRFLVANDEEWWESLTATMTSERRMRKSKLSCSSSRDRQTWQRERKSCCAIASDPKWGLAATRR